jgi:hypothetical protein
MWKRTVRRERDGVEGRGSGVAYPPIEVPDLPA